uniref:ROK family protein n=1 Tax=Eiseniibacteriota bacterium TaxID=2212470 RepID=A0A832MLR1_UNCEI
MSGLVLALDLGGTDLKAALVTPHGALVAFERVPSRAAEGPEGPLLAMDEARARLAAAGAAVRAVGVGSPGAVDPLDGSLVGRTAHLPCWDSFPLRARLEDRYGLPVAADNDANLAALAEHRLGAARGARASLTVTIGTGVGCGIVMDGRVVHGARGGAGELGHLPLGRDGARCPCGVEGCVEPEMSGGGLAARARAAGLDCPDAATVFAFAAKGELRARALVEHLADRLGAALATAVNLLNPEVVVVGGGVGQAGEALLAPVRSALERYALASHRLGLRVVPAALGERAGVTGAGLAAWDLLARAPAA